MIGRFLYVSDDEVVRLLKERVFEFIRKVIDFWVKVFLDFCREKDFGVDLDTICVERLNDVFL